MAFFTKNSSNLLSLLFTGVIFCSCNDRRIQPSEFFDITAAYHSVISYRADHEEWPHSVPELSDQFSVEYVPDRRLDGALSPLVIKDERVTILVICSDGIYQFSNDQFNEFKRGIIEGNLELINQYKLAY